MLAWNRLFPGSARFGPRRAIGRWAALMVLFVLAPAFPADAGREQLDAPLLFVKRHAYMSGHIYDDYYTWRPGGGIYVIENPAAPPEQRKIRAVIDPHTPETLGEGVYRDPNLSWDATKLLFAFKGSEQGDTSIYEIGVDGRGLRRLTEPARDCTTAPPVRALGLGRHDVSPCYLPDGRIVFTSTRQGGRVPCFNSEVDTLHVMNADGSNIQPLSVNNVNEFHPSVLPDGRILYGRWEYVDKTALYMQSLWTMNPDGTQEAALFGNNLAKPTAILHARPVPGTHLVVASLTPHNGQAVGAIAMIDPLRGKNSLDAITNFTPEFPTEMDQGLKAGPSNPWPVSADLVVIANNAKRTHAALELVHRSGEREIVHEDPDISCYSPMLIKPRPVPPVIPSEIEPGAPGRFLVQDIYQGLEGVKPGEVARLRVLEETSRVSGIPAGGRWWNQAFLVSWQGAYTIKNFLGTVPVHPDGSAYFEAPPGRALYFQALDRDGRMLQSMRTFVQAAPGVTRSCVGCHETKSATPRTEVSLPLALRQEPARPQPESWGSGFIDFPTMVQPVLDRHCVSCHGGEKDIAGGIDFSGGWTWAFNIAYETLLKNTLTGFLNCVNGAVKTAEILPPRTHGSGAAPLTQLLFDGHDGRIPELTRTERELLLAWMDGNSNYYGTWDWSEQATARAATLVNSKLADQMKPAGCVRCHGAQVGNDWVNLQRPEWSRILRAPLAKGARGNGLEWCRDCQAGEAYRPVMQPASQPPDVFEPKRVSAPASTGAPMISFTSTEQKEYQAMLAVIRQARTLALSEPRVDMPGAEIQPGLCRHLVPVPLPDHPLELRLAVEPDGVVALAWERSAATIGLRFELHRGPSPDFTPMEATRLAATSLSRHLDVAPPAGPAHYALIAITEDGRHSAPARASIAVPEPGPTPVPPKLVAHPRPGEVLLEWENTGGQRFNIYRRTPDTAELEKLNATPIALQEFADFEPPREPGSTYLVRTVSRRGIESESRTVAVVPPLPVSSEPVLVASFNQKPTATIAGRGEIAFVATGKVTAESGVLAVRPKSYLTLPALLPEEQTTRFSVECWVLLDQREGQPVIVSSGGTSGWSLQQYGKGWRWNLHDVHCQGGSAGEGEWTHLIATFDGREIRLFQDGRLVGSAACHPDRSYWPDSILIGQYAPRPRPEFQLHGRLAAFAYYHRPLLAEEVAAAFQNRPPQIAPPAKSE